MAAALGAWFFRAALWMARRNGRSIARRLASEGKSYPPARLERLLRERLEPLAAGIEPVQARDRLMEEAMTAARREWRRSQGERTGGD